jgi:thiol-disulfide isomerase/thioredoxin
MLERTVILLALAAALVIGWQALRLIQARRLRALAAEQPFAGIVPGGRPSVVAFTLPSCADCRARQAPALRRLGAQLGERASIQTLGADAYPNLVERLGLLTVPATLVLDGAGRVRFLNQGFADEQRLAEQLALVE